MKDEKGILFQENSDFAQGEVCQHSGGEVEECGG
jgi:hypothetical protein